MKELTPEQLQQVEDFASLFYSLRDIAIILEVDEAELKLQYQDKTSQVYKRYHKGFLISDCEIRKSEISLAKRGSTPAQESVKKYVNEARINNR